MTQTSIAADLDQALDVQLNLSAQVAFDNKVLADVVAQRRDLVLRQITHTRVRRDASGLQSPLRGASADAVDVGQAYLHPLVAG